MISLNKLSLLDAIINDFANTQKIIERGEPVLKNRKGKTSMLTNLKLKTGYFFKNTKLVVSSLKNLLSLRKFIKSSQKAFDKSDIRGKEDIFLLIEKGWHGVQDLPNENQALKSEQIADKLQKQFATELSSFAQKIKKELYGNELPKYTQTELEAMAYRYKDVPKDILEAGSSDKYAQRYL